MFCCSLKVNQAYGRVQAARPPAATLSAAHIAFYQSRGQGFAVPKDGAGEHDPNAGRSSVALCVYTKQYDTQYDAETTSFWGEIELK